MASSGSGADGGAPSASTVAVAFTSRGKQMFKSTNVQRDAAVSVSPPSVCSLPLPTQPANAKLLATTDPIPLPSSPLSIQAESSDYYFTSPPPPRRRSVLCFFHLHRPLLSFALQMREFRHTPCLMTPLSTFVLLVILLSSFLSAILTFPQFILGILLGPILQRKFWIVQFLYRSNAAKWGHLKLLSMAGQQQSNKRNKHSASSSPSPSSTTTSNAIKRNTNNLLVMEGGSHSHTLHQRITVVPHRVYIHPIPQFMDNIAYLIVCTPQQALDDNNKAKSSSSSSSAVSSTTSSTTTSSSSSSLPITAILIDCGESTKIIQHMECIYEHYYSHDFPRRDRRRKRRTNSRRSTENPTTACSSSGGVSSHTTNLPQPPQEEQQLLLPEIELLGIFCTHRHHDHTAGVGPLISELTKRKLLNSNGDDDADGGGLIVSAGCSISSSTTTTTTSHKQNQQQCDIYKQAPGNVVVVGGAVEHVPHCNVFVKNGCFVPLPCVARRRSTNVNGDEDIIMKNDMNDIVSMEVIGVPSHTRGSVVYALRNRMAPNVTVSIRLPSVAQQQIPNTTLSPLQTHLFTGDTIFTGGGGVPFESDLQFRKDDFIKTPAALKKKHGSSKFRPGAGVLSMERCFVEVLTRGQPPSKEAANTTTLLYPGHEYTTTLLMRQFDQKTLSGDIHWGKALPSTFFEVASHYLVSAHRRELMPEQRILTVPTPLAKEMVVNPNFRMLKRRGECVVDALRLWYEFGTKTSLCPRVADNIDQDHSQQQQPSHSVFTTVYSDHLVNVVKDLRSGKLDALSAADQIESLTRALDEKLIGRRPIPGTLPSHKNVYLGVVALAILGSAPSAVTVSDGNIMNLALPVDSTDRLLISKKRLIAALDRLGLVLVNDASPRVDDIVHLLWREARIDNELKLDIEYTTNGIDVECSINYEDEIELGLLKLSLYGVVLNQSSKLCGPCFDSHRPKYDDLSWVKKSNLRRTTGEMVRHDAESCLACRDEWRSCPSSMVKSDN